MRLSWMLQLMMVTDISNVELPIKVVADSKTRCSSVMPKVLILTLELKLFSYVVIKV